MKYLALAVAVLCSSLALAGDEKKHMQPGDSLKPFDVVDVTGTYKADPKVCYV